MREAIMPRQPMLVAPLLALLLFTVGLTLAGRAGAEAPSERGSSLDELLRPYLARYGLPAIGAAVLHDGQVVASGAAGTRRFGTDIPVSVDDRFHIGSDTKAMTVLLAALFVEDGKLRWDTRLEEVFPELAGKMDAGLRRVTLTQLMSHTSGLPSDTDEIEALVNRAMLQPGNLDAQRYWLVQEWAPKPLAASPGEKWAYSNLGTDRDAGVRSAQAAQRRVWPTIQSRPGRCPAGAQGGRRQALRLPRRPQW
jgi:CubicO group peptidase (beta-lactamase class C family)